MTTLLVFDVRGPLAHFRRPDTAVTHATYPFLTRTALHGLLGAILGTEPVQDGWAAIELRAPVRTRAQQLSMLGKMYLDGSNTKTFHRPTAVELLIQPHYRIYYTGPKQAELAEAIRQRRSVYPTYLGVAYALTVPEYVGEWAADPLEEADEEPLLCRTVSQWQR
ncbi:CRISPR-associated protein Cas5 [Calditerricola satsumensis]|uniref:CRISPR-associated protein Cas5 n=1 Tax=Calditerricola satsumensis TaxID=373054 RepID=UPI0006D1225F|nr:CRISPR-associated protein Cas5 [Calditerricola satsumensis]